MSNDRFHKLVSDATKLFEQAEANRREARQSRAIESGKLYDFSDVLGEPEIENELPINWMAVMQNKDDLKLWFAIPADTNTLVGSGDVEIPSSAACGVLVLRCGQGLWIHEDDFELGRPTGLVPDFYVDDVRDRLATIVDGSTMLSAHAALVEGDPEYEMWISQLSAMSETLEGVFRTEPQVISIASDFADAEAVSEPVLALAADTSLPDQTDSPAMPPKKPPKKWQQKFKTIDGTLTVYFYEAENQFVVCFEGARQPPALFILSHSISGGEWEHGGNDRYDWSQRIPSESQKLELLFIGQRLFFQA